jgi:hypothetical protein
MVTSIPDGWLHDGPEIGSRICFKELGMHEILVALAFVAMVACPAIVAALPQKETEHDA